MKYWRIDSLSVQKMVQDFTMSGRFWTAFPIDRVEYILRFYHAIPSDYTYRNFDEVNDTLVWAPNGNAMANELEIRTQQYLARSLTTEEEKKLNEFIEDRTEQIKLLPRKGLKTDP